jgi:hypothetical protein
VILEFARRAAISLVLITVFLGLGAEIDGRDLKTTTKWNSK